MTLRPSGRVHQHHVGEDRRAARPERPADLGTLALTVAAAALTWVMLEVAALLDRPVVTDLDWSLLANLLSTAAVSIAAVVAFLAFMRWRLRGTTNPVYVGTAVVLLGVVAVAIAQLVPELSAAAGETAFLEVLEPSARLLAGLLLLAAALTAEIDTRMTPSRVVGAALVVAVVAAAGFVLVEPAGAAMTSRTGHLGIALVWSGVATAHLVAGRRRGSRDHLAVAAAAAVLVLAGLTLGLASAAPPTTVATARLFELFALLLLLGQGLRDLEGAFCEQRARLLDTEVTVETVNTLRRVEHEAHEERAHDARSALLAIEAAATMLQRHRDQLDAGARAQIGKAMTAEVARLQDLIADDGRDDDACAPFSLAELLTPLVTTERARGTRIDVGVPGDLVAAGRGADTAEVFRNLFDNARRYAPGSPVTITGETDGDWVVVHVDDHGWGVERSERERIFGRGSRGSSSVGTDGSGLGLYVSRRLMRDQGGDLWVEPRPGGGARFAFCLPLGPPEPAPVVEEARTMTRSDALEHSGGSDG